MSPQRMSHMQLVAVFGTMILGACLGWLVAVWIWLSRVPTSHIPTALSPGLPEYVASLSCVCAAVTPFCWRWTAGPRARLFAFLISGYVLGLFVAPLKDESFESELARIWTFVVFEFHPSWGLFGAVIGGMAFCLSEFHFRTGRQQFGTAPHQATE